MNKKLYEIPVVVTILQSLTILMIGFVNIDIILKAMLIFGYFMLFRQKKWHKHLYIMFVMIFILFFSSRYIN